MKDKVYKKLSRYKLLSATNLTTIEIAFLFWIWDNNPVKLSQNELCQELGVSHHALTHYVKKLKDNGFIVRNRFERRYYFTIEITEAGRKFLRTLT